MGRDISKVIERIVAEIPAGKHEEMRHRLAAITESAQFTPPEGMGVRWQQLQRVLEDDLPMPPVEPWQVKIGRIVRGEE